MQNWANYAYNATMGDTLLQHMQIFEAGDAEYLAVMGFDPVSNSIIEAFRGT